MKKNNNGFVLVETLVVTVFVMAIFSVIYLNFYPLAGEYERREFYDDVDSKYGAYWMKRFIQSSNYNFQPLLDDIKGSQGYAFFTCDLFPEDSEDRQFCNEMWERLEVETVVVTKYKIDSFKQKVEDNPVGFSDDFVAYVEYLPEFIVASLNEAKYRVLVEFQRTAGSNEDVDVYYTYSNMEVRK